MWWEHQLSGGDEVLNRHSTAGVATTVLTAVLLLLQDVVSASSDGTLLERISKIMGYINQTSGEGGGLAGCAAASPITT